MIGNYGLLQDWDQILNIKDYSTYKIPYNPMDYYKPPKLEVGKELTEYKPKPKNIDTDALIESTTRGLAHVLGSILGRKPSAMQAPGLGGNPVPFIPTQQMYPLRQEYKPMLGRILGR